MYRIPEAERLCCQSSDDLPFSCPLLRYASLDEQSDATIQTSVAQSANSFRRGLEFAPVDRAVSIEVSGG